MKTIVEASQTMQKERPSIRVSSPANRQDAASPYVVAADIGGTNLRLALADATGEIVRRWSSSTAGLVDPSMVLLLIREGVDALLREASLPPSSVNAIAVGAPGVTDVDRGVVIATSYLMGWRDVPFRSMLEDEFGVPTFVDNDVNLAAIGEQRAGSAQGESDFVFLAIGTGIGAGIVLNGEVHRGTNWTAGEIGYMLVPGTSAAPVERGRPGAFEAMVGGEGIKAQWRQRWNRDATPLPINAIATQIFNHALEGNSLAQEVLELAARTLAYAIYNTSLILNSPLFVLGGSVGIHPALVDATRQVLAERGEHVQPRLIHSSLGADAQLIGAIFMALRTANKETAQTAS